MDDFTYPGFSGQNYSFQGQSTGKPNNTTGGGWWSTNWQPLLDTFLQGFSAYSNYNSAANANRSNVRLSREQRAWEEQMSNTAVQRRAKDIEAAGGNRALAFVNGGEATTPTVQAPQIQAPQFNAPRINTGLLLAKAQLDNIKANTYNTSADTRMKNIQGNLLSEYGAANSAEELERRAKVNSLLAHQIDKAGYDADISQQTASLLKDKMEAAIKLLEAQAKLGELNAESSEAIAKTLGVAGRDVGPVGKLFMDIVKSFLMGKFK